MSSETLKEALQTTMKTTPKSGQESHAEITQLLKNIQKQVNTMASNNISEDIDAELSETIRRLLSIPKTREGDFDLDSEAAQIVTDDVISLLEALMDEINQTDSRGFRGKRKRGFTTSR